MFYYISQWSVLIRASQRQLVRILVFVWMIERREAGQSDHFLLSTRRAIIGEKQEYLSKKTHHHSLTVGYLFCNCYFFTFSPLPAQAQGPGTSHQPPSVIFNIGFGTPRHNYVSNRYIITMYLINICFCILHSPIRFFKLNCFHQ